MTAPRSLPSLLRISLSRLERAYVVEGAGRAGMPSVDGWANLLRVLNPDGVDRRELPRLTRLSKRALRGQVSAAARRQWTEELTSGRGQGRLRLTGKGADVVVRWASLQLAAEDRWQRQVGFDRASALRTALETVVAALPLEHPHYPASYGTVDASISGGPGQDWKPVPREGSDSVAGLTMCALLSQALVAFALEYETLSPIALSISTSIVRQVPAGGRSVADLGVSVHLSALDRHGFVRIEGDGDNAMIFLTKKGRAVSDTYADRVEVVEKTWRERSGGETVSDLRQVLETIADHRGQQGSDEAPDAGGPVSGSGS